MILGIGIDVVDMKLFRSNIENPVTHFKKWHFTEGEIAYCEGQSGHDSVHHFAGYYAAKEAFIKAIGPLLDGRESEIDLAKNEEAKKAIHAKNYKEFEVVTKALRGPAMILGGRSLKVFEEYLNAKILLSITHEESIAMAMVLIDGKMIK